MISLISAPALLVILLLLVSFGLFQILLETLKNHNKKQNNILLLSILVFCVSIIFHFYKMTEVPPSGHEDDSKIVITAYILKNTWQDSSQKFIPYFPDLKIYYHNEHIGGEAERGIPIYIQTFIQYFTGPGHFSFRLESTVITLCITILIVGITCFLSKNISTSLMFGSLFTILPWARIFARTTTESTSYCFASACFIFSLFYLVKKKNFIGILIYLLSLSILYISYSPGILLAPLASILIPFILRLHSSEYKDLSTKIFIASVVLLGVLYFNFKEDAGFKHVIARAQYAQGLAGIENFDLQQLASTFLKNASTYTANYLSYLLPNFLFLTGDGNLRHNTGFSGQLFCTLCLAFYIGFIYLISMAKQELSLRLLLGYLLISFIPASVSLEGALDPITRLPLHALRAGSMLPIVGIILFLGLVQISKKSKILFSVYLLAICLNAYFFYSDYFYNYPKRLGNSWITDPGLPQTTQEALKIIKKYPSKKLFYHCSAYSIIYHNLDIIGINALLKGDGILSNVYSYLDYKDRIPIQEGDLLVVQEPFDYAGLNKKFKFILRVRNQYLPNNDFGASLIEILE